MSNWLLQHLPDWLTGSRRRQLIVHAHMFKNAGTTLDWSLQRSFGEAHVDHRDDDSMRLGASYLGPYITNEPEMQALSSHWITFPVPELKRVDLHLILMFRDPIERIRSVYNFERRQIPAETPGSKKAKELSFKDYVSWQLEPMPGPVVKNFHTRCCSGDYLGEDLELLDKKARETLESTPLLGLVERYDESMVLFEERLRPHFPDLDLSYQIQNASEHETPDPARRRQQVLDELGDIAAAVLEANRYDIALYEAAKERFDRDFAGLSDRDAKLSDLRHRCDALL